MGAQQFAHRLARPHEIDIRSLLARLAHETFNGCSRCGIEKTHRADVDDIGFRLTADPVERRSHRSRRAEEERAGNAIDNHIVIRRVRRRIGAFATVWLVGQR